MGPVAAVDPDEARRTARSILNGRQFRSSPTPRPLHRQLSWIGDRVHGFFEWIGRAFSHVPSAIALSIAVGVVVVAVVLLVRLVRARRTSPEARPAAAMAAAAALEDPAELERAADAAEHAGRLDDAVRLRFRAGLLRLGDRGAIRYRPSVTTNEVRRVLGSETFDELAGTFEAVAYGGHEATTPDVDTARREWPRVVASANRPPESR
jgi:hypothetical protein